MPLELQDVYFSDGDAVDNIYVSAFIDDRFNQTLYPGMTFDQLIAGSRTRWSRSYGTSSAYYRKVVNTDTGEVVSYSRWVFENTTVREQLQKPTGLPVDLVLPPPSTPKGLNEPFATEFSKKYSAIRKKHLDKHPVLRLDMLGTLPFYERRGAASLQLAWATELADRESLLLYTEGSIAATPLYKKFGMEPIADIVMDLLDGGTYTTTCLLRKPKRCIQ